jgi:hypothetical protein
MAYSDPAQQKLAAQQHYENNKQAYKDRALAHTKEARQRNRNYVDAAKSVPCADCGVQYPPYVMQFDHLGDNKDSNVSAMVNKARPIKVIQAEIDKCEVVCANCHAQRTHDRL